MLVRTKKAAGLRPLKSLQIDIAAGLRPVKRLANFCRPMAGKKAYKSAGNRPVKKQTLEDLFKMI
jgi:hypothetical protein